jgi:translation initiation factor 1
MNKKKSGGVVYSTDKDFKFEEETGENISISPAEQRLKIRLETKQRGGKAVTIVDGFVGNNMEEIGRQLKAFCGTGGSVKDRQIIVQGDNRDKVLQWLLKQGFVNSKRI